MGDILRYTTLLRSPRAYCGRIDARYMADRTASPVAYSEIIGGGLLRVVTATVLSETAGLDQSISTTHHIGRSTVLWPTEHRTIGQQTAQVDGSLTRGCIPRDAMCRLDHHLDNRDLAQTSTSPLANILPQQLLASPFWTLSSQGQHVSWKSGR